MKIFLAHAKADSEAKIAEMKEQCERYFKEAAAGRATIEVVLGHEDFNANFKRCGSLDAWARDVIDRVDYATRVPVYKAIVVTSIRVGAATAKIIATAILHGTRVYVMAGGVLQVHSIEKVSDDFRDGWEVKP